jgi:hypothetical protein
MKFNFNFYEYDNISPDLNNNLKCKYKNISECKNICKFKKCSGFTIYNNYVYFYYYNLSSFVTKLKYLKNSKCFLYTNILIDEKTVDERLYLYTYGLNKYINNKINFLKKKDKFTNRIIRYDINYEQTKLRKKDFETHISYKILNIYDIYNIINNYSRNKFINRHYINFLSYISKYKNKKKKNFKMVPFDLNESCNVCTFVKSRNLIDSKMSILLPLEKIYLPYNRLEEIKDDIEFKNKKLKVIWRGTNSGNFDLKKKNRGSRIHLIKKYFNSQNKRIDVGLSSILYEKELYENDYKMYIKNFVSIKDQLKNMFIICVEGNDFPTNLFWVFLSNSVPFMPKPYVETWFMESNLKEWYHYVPLKNDFSDLEEKLNYCINNLSLCSNISLNSKIYSLQFLNKEKEHKIIDKVVDYYFKHTF